MNDNHIRIGRIIITFRTNIVTWGDLVCKYFAVLQLLQGRPSVIIVSAAWHAILTNSEYELVAHFKLT